MSGFAILLYVLGSVIVGLMGRDTAMGFLGLFLLSVVLSPVIGLLLLLLFRPNRRLRAALLRIKLGEQGRSR